VTEREIFFEALEMTTPEARAAYLQRACGLDVRLRRKVEELLKEHFSNDSLLAGCALGGERPGLVELLVEEASAHLIGRYKLLEKLGEGGFGEVWMAEQREPVKRRVALKIIKLGMDSRQIVARFEAERQALAMMDHANIARIFDAGMTDSGRPYFVMELVRGMKITDYCDQNQLPTRERLDLFIKVCQAIQHAHQKGIIHRDIKPSNILVTRHDGPAGAGMPKVIDFGIAKATQQELTDKTVFTQFQQFIGTPAYISPEQAEMSGLDIDTRADIYSLGVLLYELLVGQTPFDAKEMMQGGLDALRQIIREKEPLRPSTRLNTLRGDGRTTAGKCRQTDVGKLAHQLQGDLDWIVMKCLEKDRARRYESASGLASDLQRHLNNEPVLARPPSAAYRFQKLVRRNKLAFAAASAIAMVLVLGVIVSSWQAIRATQAKHEAIEQRKLADMQLALQAWEEGDLQRANDLIEASRPASGQPPSFEWRYLRKLCQDQSVETLDAPNHNYRAAMFIGRDLLLLTEPKALTLHDLSRRNDQPLLEDEDGIWHPAICSGNTNLLATVTDAAGLKVWDLAARRLQYELQRPLRAPTTAPSTSTNAKIAFSRDGKWLASAVSDTSVKLWELGASTPPLSRTIHRYAAWSGVGVFSSDGTYLFTGGSEPMVRPWNVATGMEDGPRFEGHTAWVYALALSPDGRWLASGGADGTVRVWDANARKLVTTFLGHIAMVNAVAFSPNGQILASAGRDLTIRLWDLQSRQQLSPLRGHRAIVDCVSFSPDGMWLVSRSQDGLVKLWKTAPAQKGDILTGGQGLLEVAWSPDGHHLASVGSQNEEVHLWDLVTRRRTTLNGHTGSVMCAAFSPDGGLLATGSHDQTVRLWDVSDHKVAAILTNGFPVGSLAFSPDGHTLVVGGSKHYFLVEDQGGLQFWDVPSRQATGSIPGNATDIVQVSMSDRGTMLATGHKDGAVSLWEVSSRRLLHRFASQFGVSVLSLAFSPNRPLLAVSDWNGNIVLYNTTTMESEPGPLKAHSGRVTSLAFSPDGGTLAAAGEGGGLKLWRVAIHQMALALKGHVSAVKGVAFSRDGNFLASCALDGTVRLWRAATLEEADAATKPKTKSR
jgi:WD40 repeat protein/serine/threonine protein kinase